MARWLSENAPWLCVLWLLCGSLIAFCWARFARRPVGIAGEQEFPEARPTFEFYEIPEVSISVDARSLIDGLSRVERAWRHYEKAIARRRTYFDLPEALAEGAANGMGC